MAHVRLGAEVVIENETRAVAVVRPAVPAGPSRLLSEIIAAAESCGSSALLDGDFARDLEEVINSHPEPLDPPAWDQRGGADRVGLILDSSVVIAAERQRETVAQLPRRIVATAGDQRAALSAVGLTELVHAIYRARNPVHRQNHERFIADLLTDMEVFPTPKRRRYWPGRSTTALLPSRGTHCT